MPTKKKATYHWWRNRRRKKKLSPEENKKLIKVLTKELRALRRHGSKPQTMIWLGTKKQLKEFLKNVTPT